MTCTEQIWSQTKLLRGGDRKKNSVAVQASNIRGGVMNRTQTRNEFLRGKAWRASLELEQLQM